CEAINEARDRRACLPRCGRYEIVIPAHSGNSVSDLERAEGMFSCLTTLAHRLRVLIESLLHGFEHVFAFPSCNPAFATCRAARFEGTARTCRCPIATQRLALFLVGVPVGQLLTRWAAVDILWRQH